jgi:hypothetical protein
MRRRKDFIDETLNVAVLVTIIALVAMLVRYLWK